MVEVYEKVVYDLKGLTPEQYEVRRYLNVSPIFLVKADKKF